VGKPRASVTAPRLAELNSYVPIKLLEGEGEVTTDMVAPYQVGLSVIRLTTGRCSHQRNDQQAGRD
jgi:hypothetical protein